MHDNLELDEEQEYNKLTYLTDKLCYYINQELFFKNRDAKRHSSEMFRKRPKSEKPVDSSVRDKLQNVIRRKLKRDPEEIGSEPIESSEDA